MEILNDGSPRTLKQIRNEVAQKRKFSEEELREMLPSQRQTLFHDRLNWAVQYLFQGGLLERPKRATYTLSSIGKEYITEKGFNITLDDLRQYERFRGFYHKEQNALDHEAATPNTITESEETPEDLISRAQRMLNQQLSEDLMQEILAMDPIFFEKLVLDLLIAMGYGGKDETNIIRTPATGDGGIDGLIKEDELGLEYIYVQAKRWQPGRKVSRPDVQTFIGALSGQSARKGVFITTADFTAEARAFAENNKAGKVVLINGEELTRLMITYGVGLSTVSEYKIQIIDSDYFVDE